MDRNDLAAEAKQAGMAMEDYLLSLVDEHLTLSSAKTPDIEEWEALLRSIGVPAHVMSDEDTRRENLYGNYV